MGLKLMYALHLTCGWTTMEARFTARLWQAARHVEALAETHFFFAQPPAGVAAGATGGHMPASAVVEVPMEEAVAAWEGQRWSGGPGAGSGQQRRPPYPATVTIQGCSPRAFLTITADDFVLLLVALFSCTNVAQAAVPTAWRISYNIWAYVAVRERVRAELLPQLAARSAGRPWALSVEAMEGVWASACVSGLSAAVRSGLADPAHGSYNQALVAYRYGCDRLVALAPALSPLALQPVWLAVMEHGQLPQIVSFSEAMARRGEAEGCDPALVIGQSTLLRLVLKGSLRGSPGPYGRSPYPLGELRAMYGRARGAQRRLARWNMAAGALKNMCGEAMDIAKRCLATLAAEPDSALVRLPAKEQQQPPGSASSKGSKTGKKKGATTTTNTTNTTNTTTTTGSRSDGADKSSSSGAAAAATAAAATAAAPANGDDDGAGPPCGGGAVVTSILAPGERLCDGCERGSLVTRKCGQCRQRRYCSQDCQAKHWRAGHKTECKRLAAEAAAGAAAGACAG
ncbi:hypothetical protein HYH02_009418 [Chlamydomonas schloesseri]|uniref:MYND-type domain-containing protein n=1 Tax=Chlamydomonas schloesseri TaxID=2026947 RepID=A0A835TCL5_9CHLO|nr:hypothetical protein HYH02_009418 [Chlamydomonas schloesseri]|eukprot:KAG2443002.1 hypothetical protein HYH02_009418 [Chlamydomonas schloesseri]